MADDNKKKDTSNVQGIPGMKLEEKYSTKKPIMPENTEKMQKEMEKTKKELDKLKNWIIKKYKFTQALGILPPQAAKVFIDEEEVPAETEKFLQLYMIIPEEQYKNIPKIKSEIIKEVEKIKGQKIWLQIKTPVDVWENCLDLKFDLTSAIAMSFPLYDKGFLGALRVAEIHKSLVVRKFDKYVVSYVISGSLVRGDAVPTSDVDVFIIINDTDVKRMPRVELKERLRSMIYQYVSEAASLAGVKNKLSPQVWLLTDFWEGVKDAQPVYFTSIRDGVPIYDRHTFMPWKALLKMGKLKPSPEAIDMFMSMGDKVVKRSKKTLLSNIFVDIFWGITSPAQALLMLNGMAPPNPKKELVPAFKKQFYDTKMIEKKYVDFLQRVISTWRDYEHEKITEISGKDIDKLLKDTEDYLKRLKELRKQIEKKYQKQTIDQVHEDVFKLLKAFMGNKPQEEIIKEFEKSYVKKGKFTHQHLRILNNIVNARKEHKKGKASVKKIDDARKNAKILMDSLIEYTQRCDLVALDKTKMAVRLKDGMAQLINANGMTFLLMGNQVKKVTKKIEDSSLDEMEAAVKAQKSKQFVEINPDVFKVLKKEFKDFEIVL